MARTPSLSPMAPPPSRRRSAEGHAAALPLPVAPGPSHFPCPRRLVRAEGWCTRVRRHRCLSPLPPGSLSAGEGGARWHATPRLVRAGGGTRGHSAALSLSPPALRFPLSVPPRSRGRVVHEGTPPPPPLPIALGPPVRGGEGAARWHAAPASFARKGTRGHAAPLSPLPPPYSLSAPSRSRGSGAHDARAASPSPVAAPPRSRGGGLHEGTPPPLRSPLPLRVPLSAPRQFVRKGGARRRRRPVLARRGCTRAHTPSPVATPPRSHGSGAHDAAAASPSPVAAPPRSRGGGVHEGTPPPLRSPLPLRVPLSAPRQFGRKGCARASRLAQPTVRCGKGKRGRRHPHRARKGARKGELSPPAPTRRTAGPAVPARALMSLPVFARHSTT
ncbi:hypothetical protein EDB89DRAFT_2080834 [Lactarius sanguifluus]|nr:hypothetical protein EDB89DRAFT_2080834 [Lactarius sanguifluus]